MTVRVCGITDYHPLLTIWLHRLFLGCSVFWKPVGTEDGGRDVAWDRGRDEFALTQTPKILSLF